VVQCIHYTATRAPFLSLLLILLVVVSNYWQGTRESQIQKSQKENGRKKLNNGFASVQKRKKNLKEEARTGSEDVFFIVTFTKAKEKVKLAS